MGSNFYEIWHLEQTQHAIYEYSAWNWGSWSKITDLGKLGPSTEICSNFHEIWHSGHIWYANYRYSALNRKSRPKEKNLGKYGIKHEMCAMLMN